MKISEIIVEAGEETQQTQRPSLWNRLKGGIVGAQAGYQQSQARNQIADLAKSSFKQWNQRVAGNPAAAQSPEELYKFAQQMAPRVGNLPAAPAQMTPANILNYFNTVTGLALSGPGPDEVANTPRPQNNINPTATAPVAKSNAPQQPKPIAQVNLPVHGAITKGADGKWRDQEGAIITNPREIEELESLSAPMRYAQQAATPGGAPNMLAKI